MKFFSTSELKLLDNLLKNPQDDHQKIVSLFEKKIEDYTRKLRESEVKYKNLITSLMDIIVEIDMNSNFLYASPQAYDIFGYRPEEVIGKRGFDFIHPDDKKAAIEILKKAIKQRERVYIEYRALHKKGYYIYVSATGRIVNIEEENRIIAVIRDISERKISEQKLRESEEKYRKLFDNAQFAIVLFNIEGDILDCNDAVLTITGYSKDELIGKKFKDFDLYVDIEAAMLEERNEIIRYGGTPTPREILLYKKDKSQFWARSYIDFIHLGERTYLQAIIQDITEQIAAEEKLKESEERYRYLIENSIEGVWMVDSNADTVLVNPSMANILGYSVGEMVGTSLFSYMDEESIETTKIHLEKRKKGISGERDAEMIHKNGNKVYLRIRATPIFDKEGNYEGTYAFLADVTQRKLAKQKLKESEEKYRHLYESSPNAILLINMKGEVIDCNLTSEKISGFNRSELIGKNINNTSFIPKKYMPFVLEDFKRLFKEKVIEPREIQLQTKGGLPAWISYQASIFDIENEKIIQVIIQNISEQKEAEQKVKESEEKYRSLFENMNAGFAYHEVIVNDNNEPIDYKYIEVNPGFEKLTGLKKEDLIGKTVTEAIPGTENDPADWIGKFGNVGLTGIPLIVEDYSEAIDKYFKVSGYSPKKGYFAVTFTDITDHKKAEQKLKESEEKFRTIAEQAFMGILIIQNDEIKYVNNALLNIFEYSQNNVDGMIKDDLLRFIHPEDLQYLREYRKKLRSYDKNIKPYYSYRVYTKTGKMKWIDQFSKNIIYKGKTAELVTIIDISEKKQAEQELVNLNNLKSELLRRTSHELKTPLVSIKGFSDLLLNVHKEKLDDYVLATIVEIKQGCERLESLIQDILNTAELESDTVQLKKTEEDLAFLIKLSIRELQGLAKLRNHTINLKIHDKLITSFEQEQIHRVISNLISNAIKYSPPDGTIEIKSEIKDNIIIISIKDTGIGITREEKERMFTQFGKIERYGQGLDIVSDGTGLGLYISKKIIELHGGKIWVESEGRNKGSTFHFSLPLITENSSEIKL